MVKNWNRETHQYHELVTLRHQNSRHIMNATTLNFH